MAHIGIKSLWIFELDSSESVLILKALGGRLKADETEKAKELGNKLTRQRSQAVETMLEQMKAHESKIGS